MKQSSQSETMKVIKKHILMLTDSVNECKNTTKWDENYLIRLQRK